MGIFEDEDHLHITQERCQGGSLATSLAKSGHLSERAARRAMHSVLSALAHCHAMHVLYRCVTSNCPGLACGCLLVPILCYSCQTTAQSSVHTPPPWADFCDTMPSCLGAGCCRDVKPDHFLLVNSSDKLSLKAIDFGISIFLKPGELCETPAGTPAYWAPEVCGQTTDGIMRC